MATTDVALHEASGRLEPKRVVNNMSIQVATVNGSGSQSSNTVLLRSIFQMGVPVSGKNLFPSNIAGLPTWYTIRANKDGYVARKKEIDFVVAMNSETAQEDVMSLAPGAAVLYDEPTTMVDPLMAHLLGDLIERLKQQLHLTSIVVTHDMRLAKKLADRVVFLNAGKAIFFGTMEEMERSKDPVLQEFLEMDELTIPA